MLVSFGVSTSDRRTVQKNFNVTTALECSIKDKTTILRPTFVLAYSKELTSCNYVYVEELGRYYYLGNPVIGMDGTVELPAEVDPIMSWRPYILNLYCLISRQENIYQPYIIDDKILTRCDKVQSIHNVGEIGLDNNLRYYLVTTGG